ncbi:MAG: hypothetical protein JO104_02565, partial [Candidatus Eremiobacteraeota bacterium]|nr:hypothetical protein [Candidatus Eremiobacteraeota bacterium]
GEHVLRLPSLAVPPQDDVVTPQVLLSYGAVALFADRALAADGRFAVTSENAPFVAEICRRLDGIPLAIELAAARITVLSPQHLAQRLDERFRVLTGGDRSALPRHQTMRALIDWSYDLLSEPERSLFRKLSIFAGGFTLEGAAAVCGDADCDDLAVLDLISSLVDKSLVQSDPGTDQRYRLLESTRQYAREKLAEHGELEADADRHLAFVLALFERSGKEYEATDSDTAVRQLAVELEDARSAFDWAERRHATKDAIDLFLATRLWDYLGLHREALERVNRLLAIVGEDDAAERARLWERMAYSAGWIGHSGTAKDAAERSVAYARTSNEPAVLVDALLRFADVTARAGSFGEALIALDGAERLGGFSPRQSVQMLHARSLIGLWAGDLESASRYNAQVRDLYESLGNDVGTSSAALNLAEIEHKRGATAAAAKIVMEELPHAERLPDRGMWAHLMENLAGYLDALGDVEGARRAACTAIAFYAPRDPDGPFAAVALEHLALALAIDGDFSTAATLEGYVEKTLAQHRFEREHTERNSHERLSRILHENLTKDELREHLTQGGRMSGAAAIASTACSEIAT